MPKQMRGYTGQNHPGLSECGEEILHTGTETEILFHPMKEESPASVIQIQTGNEVPSTTITQQCACEDDESLYPLPASTEESDTNAQKLRMPEPQICIELKRSCTHLLGRTFFFAITKERNELDPLTEIEGRNTRNDFETMLVSD